MSVYYFPIQVLLEFGFELEKLQLLVLFQDYVAEVSTTRLNKVDWRVLWSEDLGEEFVFLRQQCIKTARKKRPKKTKTKAPEASLSAPNESLASPADPVPKECVMVLQDEKTVEKEVYSPAPTIPLGGKVGKHKNFSFVHTELIFKVSV